MRPEPLRVWVQRRMVVSASGHAGWCAGVCLLALPRTSLPSSMKMASTGSASISSWLELASCRVSAEATAFAVRYAARLDEVFRSIAGGQCGQRGFGRLAQLAVGHQIGIFLDGFKVVLEFLLQAGIAGCLPQRVGERTGFPGLAAPVRLRR